MKRVVASLALVLALGACTPQQAIRAFWPGDAEYRKAESVALCESGLNANAMSPGGGNHGLFQINNVHRAAFERVTGKPWSARYDAHANAQFARWLYNQHGWRPWACG